MLVVLRSTVGLGLWAGYPETECFLTCLHLGYCFLTLTEILSQSASKRDVKSFKTGGDKYLF